MSAAELTMIDLVTSFVIPAAMRVLGEKYDTVEARAMLLAIGLQESRFTHRAQVRGPARGFWQFEAGGVSGVLTHKASSAPALEALALLQYADLGEPLRATAIRVHGIIEHNDVLAAVLARLLLWTLPGSLPKAGQAEEGWRAYTSAWRPGSPHRETWDSFFAEAWDRAERGVLEHRK